MAIERLDICNQFLLPARCAQKKHKTIETTDIMLQMVASGVAALPRWLAVEYADRLQLSTVQLSAHGISKQIFLGARDNDHAIDYLQ